MVLGCSDLASIKDHFSQYLNQTWVFDSSWGLNLFCLQNVLFYDCGSAIESKWYCWKKVRAAAEFAMGEECTCKTREKIQAKLWNAL